MGHIHKIINLHRMRQALATSGTDTHQQAICARNAQAAIAVLART